MNSIDSPKHQIKPEAAHRDLKHTASPAKGSRTLNVHIDKNPEEMQMDLGLKDHVRSQSPVRMLDGTLDQRSSPSLRDATKLKSSPVANLTTPSKEMPDLGTSRTLNGSPLLMKTPEVRLSKISSPVTKIPPQRTPRELQFSSSPTLNGSPVPLKTPEVHLSRVDSPIASASTRRTSLDSQCASQQLKHAPSSQHTPPPELQPPPPPPWSMQTQPVQVAQASVKESLQHAQSPRDTRFILIKVQSNTSALLRPP